MHAKRRCVSHDTEGISKLKVVIAKSFIQLGRRLKSAAEWCGGFVACPRRGRCRRFSTGSGCPSHFRTGTGARFFGVNNLLCEELVEGESDFLWRASFDDVPCGQPEAEQVPEASRARQDHVVCEPYGLGAEARGERPVRNQAGIRRFALHPVQGALLPRQ